MGKDNSAINTYSHSEEKANAISHVIGAIMSLVVCSVFILKSIPSGNALSIFSLCIYFFGVVSSYIASSVYHSCPLRKENHRLLFRKFDHAAIYWHIAGSYTPITLIAMYNNGATAWAIGFTVFILISLNSI